MIRYIYDDQTLHTRSAAWSEPRYIERVGSLLLIFSDSDKSHAGRLLLLAPAQQARSIANTLAITLRECVQRQDRAINLSLCSRATLLYIVTFLNLVSYIPQNSILRLAVCILHPTETQSPSHIQNTKDTPTITSFTITSSRGPNGGSSALPRPSSYTAAPRRTAPGPSNLCPSYLTTFITIHSSYGCLVKKKVCKG